MDLYIAECEEQGIVWHELYKNEPKLKETYPTERTCSVEVENRYEAGYICELPGEFVESLESLGISLMGVTKIRVTEDENYDGF